MRIKESGLFFTSSSMGDDGVYVGINMVFLNLRSVILVSIVCFDR